MAVQAPLWIGSVDHPERAVRLGLTAFTGAPTTSLSRPGGVVPGYGGQLAVTQNSPTGMSVQVATGAGLLPGSVSPTQGSYLAVNDAAIAVTLSASHSTLDRIDVVVMRVRDDDYGDAIGTVGGAIEVVTGTPGSPPTAPGIPANSVRLATIAVTHGSSSVLNGNITDGRYWQVATGGVHPCASTDRPAGPYLGMKIYEINTGFELTWNGSGWKYVPFRPATVHLTRNAVQSIPTSVLTPVSFTVNQRSTAFVVSLPHTVFTIPAGLEGEYDVKFWASFAASTGGAQRIAQLFLNAAILVEDRRAPVTGLGGTLPTTCGGATSVYLTAGDQLSLKVWQDSGGALNLDGQAWPRLTITRTSDA